MDIRKIGFPRSSSVASVMRFARELHAVPVARTYLFDFQNLLFVSPFTLLFLSSEITQFSEARKGSELLHINYEQYTYAAHMGFFKACGFDHGKNPGEAQGNKNYQPIIVLKTEDLVFEAREERERIGNTINRHSENFAHMLTRMPSGPMVDLLTFSIREILRNIVEHSRSRELQLCAQYWPNNHLAEVAILDTGVGIQETLKHNPYLEVRNDRDALNVALLPGVSGKTWKGRRPPDSDDPWANSGYGLHMTSGLCRDGGNFFMCSGKSGVLLRGDSKYDFDTDFRGTAIRMRLRDDDPTPVSKRLVAISRAGSAIQRRLKGTTRLNASVASRMLARDFTS